MALPEAGVRLVAEGAGQFQGQLERASRGVEQFGRNAGGAAGGIDLMSVATVALGSALGELAVRGLEAATNAITGFIRSGFDYNKSIENATAQLVAFTGSQEAAAEALDLVERKAASTPFAFDEMAQSAASLAATSRATGASLESLLDLATRLAASNPAEGLEGAAFALREAFSGDFISLQERFNIGKDTVKEIKEAGVSVETLSAAFNDLGITTELVTGLADTFDGRMGALIDKVKQLAGAFTDPIFDAFSGFIGDVNIGIDENMAKLEEDARWVGQVAADVFTTAREAWSGEWVDDEQIIMPIHRFTGNATLAIKEMWDKIVFFGEESWPLIVAQWNKFTAELDTLKKAWKPFNEIVDSTVYLFGELWRLTENLGISYGLMDEKTDGVNKKFVQTVSLGDALARIFTSIADAIDRIASTIGYVADQLERAAGAGSAFQDDTKGIGGGAPGLGDVPDTAPTGEYAQPPPASTGMTNGGGVPKAFSPRGASGGGMVNRNNVTINAPITIPAGVSPATASKIVTDGVLAAQRSRGMA